MVDLCCFLKESDKQLLLENYCDIEWLEDVKLLQCVRCDNVAIFHYISSCQHVFCRNCKRVFSDGGQWKCPRCNKYINHLDEQDWNFEVKIHQTKIFCPNKKFGCRTSGHLRNIMGHFKNCIYTRDACLPRELHVSNTTESIITQLAQLQKDVNQMKINFEDPSSQIFKKINEIDCKVEEKLKFTEDMKKWQNDQWNILNEMSDKINLVKSTWDDEMQQMKLTVNQLNSRITELENEFQTFQPISTSFISNRVQKDELVTISKDYDFIEWKISDFMQKLRKDDFNLETETFQLPGKNFGVKIKLTKEYLTLRMKISVQFINLSSDKSAINSAFSKIVYVVSNQNDEDRKKDFIRVCPHLFSDQLEFDQCLFEETLLYQHQLEPSYYLKDNQIKILIYFYSASITHFSSICGSLTWKLENYCERKKLERNMLVSCHESEFFYTKLRGYLIQLQVTLNSELIMVKILFLRGKFDSFLSLNFKHKTTVSVVNHLNRLADVTEVVQEDLATSYCIYLGKVKAREGFIHDDSIEIHVSIQQIDDDDVKKTVVNI
ncbi:hypothetical protein CHUAL_012117 [Chamberlinius hualienensis]